MFPNAVKKLIAIILAAAILLPGAAFAKDELQNYDHDKYLVEVDVSNQVVTVYQKDDDGEFTRIVRRFVCTTGQTQDKGIDDPASPTPTGKWKAGTRERFGKFANFTGEYARYWTQVVGGIYFHSIMFGSREADDLKKSPYNTLGKDASHGCIRLYIEDAKWLYYNACFGTTVNIVSKGRQKGLTASLKSELSFKDYNALQSNIYDEEPMEDAQAWIVKDNTELRTGNGTNDKLIKRLEKDTELTVLQEGDPWAKVVADGREGYVRRCYITYEKGVMQSREDGKFVAGTQNLYAAPDTGSERLYKVARHSSIVVVDDQIDPDGKWTLVNYWGTLGYLQSRNIKTGWATIYDEPFATDMDKDVDIGVDAARQAALSHAEVSAEDIVMAKDGERISWNGTDRQSYLFEFYTSDLTKEYEYEIDPATGLILGYDYDAESVDVEEMKAAEEAALAAAEEAARLAEEAAKAAEEAEASSEG